LYSVKFHFFKIFSDFRRYFATVKTLTMTKSVVRYSDAELAEFKVLIEDRLAKAKTQLENLHNQILEITENSSDEHGGDWMDDTSINSDIEMLNNMAIRQRMYVRELENALVRIRNKTYGICTVTGELIYKRRLIAVPTTTKSLAAKNGAPANTRIGEPVKTKAKEGQPKVITKVIRKSAESKPQPAPVEEDDDFDNDLFYEDDTLPEEVDGFDIVDASEEEE